MLVLPQTPSPAPQRVTGEWILPVTNSFCTSAWPLHDHVEKCSRRLPHAPSCDCCGVPARRSAPADHQRAAPTPRRVAGAKELVRSQPAAAANRGAIASHPYPRRLPFGPAFAQGIPAPPPLGAQQDCRRAGWTAPKSRRSEHLPHRRERHLARPPAIVTTRPRGTARLGSRARCAHPAQTLAGEGLCPKPARRRLRRHRKPTRPTQADLGPLFRPRHPRPTPLGRAVAR